MKKIITATIIFLQFFISATSFANENVYPTPKQFRAVVSLVKSLYPGFQDVPYSQWRQIDEGYKKCIQIKGKPYVIIMRWDGQLVININRMYLDREEERVIGYWDNLQ